MVSFYFSLLIYGLSFCQKKQNKNTTPRHMWCTLLLGHHVDHLPKTEPFFCWLCMYIDIFVLITVLYVWIKTCTFSESWVISKSTTTQDREERNTTRQRHHVSLSHIQFNIEMINDNHQGFQTSGKLKSNGTQACSFFTTVTKTEPPSTCGSSRVNTQAGNVH